MITGEIFLAGAVRIMGLQWEENLITGQEVPIIAEGLTRHGTETDPALSKEYQTGRPDRVPGTVDRVPGQEEAGLANNLFLTISIS